MRPNNSPLAQSDNLSAGLHNNVSQQMATNTKNYIAMTDSQGASTLKAGDEPPLQPRLHRSMDCESAKIGLSSPVPKETLDKSCYRTGALGTGVLDWPFALVNLKSKENHCCHKESSPAVQS